MHHVEVIEDVGNLGILRGEFRAQFLRHGHEGPFHRWCVEVAVIGAQDRFHDVLFDVQSRGCAQRVIHRHLQVVIGPDGGVEERELSAKRFGIGKGIQTLMIQTLGRNRIHAVPIKRQHFTDSGLFVHQVRAVDVVSGPMQGMRFIEGILGFQANFI